MVGAVVGAAAVTLSESPAVWGAGVTFPVFLALLAGALWLNVLMHELGHVLSGVRAGFEFRALAVWPLMFERGRGLRRLRSPSLGFAWLAPPLTSDLARRMRRMVAGGPLAGFGFGLGCALLGMLLVPGPLKGFLALSALLSVALNGLSAWPSSVGGLMTDGARLLRLGRGSRTARAEAALLALTSFAMAGRRPRDWPEALLDDALAPQGMKAFDLASASLAFYAAFDVGDELAAELHLARAEELLPIVTEALRTPVYLDRAFLEARRGNAVAARQAMGRAKKSAFVSEATWARVEAAIFLAEGQPRHALARAESGLRQASAGTVIRGVEEPWLRALRDEALRASRGPART
ncbi:hypothetical protein DES52_101322 [Deinococcus yavapaiensis KR-236]|uniref:Peptidase M50-like protein n=2 Tax=Deinococcus TaxID=1298 RepID=A0A318SBY5_9DEIO|nr:hypothetical protein DES52_101322 [Deinococcus yavapaiensis KR-236]